MKPNERTIYHTMTIEQADYWEKTTGDYYHPSLETEGFIHLSKLHQLPWVKEIFHNNSENLFIMTVSTDKLTTRLAFEKPKERIEPVEAISGDPWFPHIYGPINRAAIVSVLPYKRIYVDWLIDHFDFNRLPVEGTYYKSTYQGEITEGLPHSTGMIGMYSAEPLSVSCFHKLSRPEMWHFYGGDPLELFLLHEDGSDECVVLGPCLYTGHKIQYMIPAGVWQAGRVRRGGSYSLFGCTLAPGFTPDCFEAGLKEELISKYPSRQADIEELSVNGNETKMPDNLR